MMSDSERRSTMKTVYRVDKFDPSRKPSFLTVFFDSLDEMKDFCGSEKLEELDLGGWKAKSGNTEYLVHKVIRW